MAGGARLGVAALEGVADGGDDICSSHGARAAVAGGCLAVVAAIQQEDLGHAARCYALPHAL